MKRLVSTFAALAAVAFVLTVSSPAMAISAFSKEWKSVYLSGDDVAPEFVKTGRKAGCYVCHVKGVKDKKSDESRNEYGTAMQKFLDHKDFSKEFLKAEPEKAKKMIQAGFEKAAELKSKDGEKFGDKIKAGKLPATDAGL